ncbi:SAM-dependent methyltransferase [Subtercola sp. Z020]|uniref:class I SAM-dependent methyltransferase n=1 Tax=Subtercola sp. Z020 TaxID=2080582 RepID=UPI000CE81B20|nr:class I SAM-dependent methyltransferase [Subtercola sp. Z020]PPF79784.1 SAM-dependent methyltransferase [Subtercola sp. Z020]
MTRNTAHALSFGKAVTEYERGRPGYPIEAIDWIRAEVAGAAVAGVPLTVVDIGAGTGKFTAALLGYGDEVIAVEPDAAMRAALAGKFPEVRALEGTGEALPLDDGIADLVTFAQAWHWVEVPAASAEVARVLKPGGALALVWNIRDERVDWVARLGQIMGTSAAEDYDSVTPPVASPLQTTSHAEFFWDNPVSRDGLLAMVTSRSYIITMEPDARAEVLRDIEALLDGHPDLAGQTRYTMPYVTRVTLARAGSPDRT